MDSNNGYLFQSEICSSNINQGATFNNNSQRDEKWMQYLTDEPFSSTTPAFQSHGSMALVPSKVDIALECARLQHRLSLPPLEVDDFPAVNFADMKMPQTGVICENTIGGDILNEILSVACASQELINPLNFQNTWPGNYSSYLNESSIPHGMDLVPIEKPLGVNDTRLHKFMDFTMSAYESGSSQADLSKCINSLENLLDSKNWDLQVAEFKKQKYNVGRHRKMTNK